MVAPISVTVPSSTSCSSPSCWVRLKRWISSMNRIGRRPRARCFLASSKLLLQVGHARPSPPTAPSAARPTSLASSRASVVFPQPGGPHRISDASRPRSSIRASGASGRSSCSWPTSSASTVGRSRSASGRSAAARGAAVAGRARAARTGRAWRQSSRRRAARSAAAAWVRACRRGVRSCIFNSSTAWIGPIARSGL